MFASLTMCPWRFSVNHVILILECFVGSNWVSYLVWRRFASHSKGFFSSEGQCRKPGYLTPEWVAATTQNEDMVKSIQSGGALILWLGIMWVVKITWAQMRMTPRSSFTLTRPQDSHTAAIIVLCRISCIGHICSCLITYCWISATI